MPIDGWSGRRCLVMPAGINWGAMRDVYEFQPRGYEELVAELVYGEEASWRDPVRFSFAFGGKDGVPFPVDREAMDETVELLRVGIDSAHVKRREKLGAVKWLQRCVPQIPDERL